MDDNALGTAPCTVEVCPDPASCDALGDCGIVRMSAPEITRLSTNIRLDRDVHDRLKAEAARRMVSVNWLITKAVERSLPAWEEQVFDV